MSYSQILLTIRSQQHDRRVRHDSIRRVVDGRRSRPNQCRDMSAITFAVLAVFARELGDHAAAGQHLEAAQRHSRKAARERQLVEIASLIVADEHERGSWSCLRAHSEFPSDDELLASFFRSPSVRDHGEELMDDVVERRPIGVTQAVELLSDVAGKRFRSRAAIGRRRDGCNGDRRSARPAIRAQVGGRPRQSDAPARGSSSRRPTTRRGRSAGPEQQLLDTDACLLILQEFMPGSTVEWLSAEPRRFVVRLA